LTATGAVTLNSGQTLALDGVTITGNPTFSGTPVIPQRAWVVQLQATINTGQFGALPFKGYNVEYDKYIESNYQVINTGHFSTTNLFEFHGTTSQGTPRLSSAIGGAYLLMYNPLDVSPQVTFTFTSSDFFQVPAASISSFSTSSAVLKHVYLPANWSLKATFPNYIPTTGPWQTWEFAMAFLS
jgi:hypothetical protein